MTNNEVEFEYLESEIGELAAKQVSPQPVTGDKEPEDAQIDSPQSQLAKAMYAWVVSRL